MHQVSFYNEVESNDSSNDECNLYELDFDSALAFLSSLEIEPLPETADPQATFSDDIAEPETTPNFTVVALSRLQNVDETSLLRQGILGAMCYFSYSKSPAYVFSSIETTRLVTRTANSNKRLKANTYHEAPPAARTVRFKLENSFVSKLQTGFRAFGSLLPKRRAIPQQQSDKHRWAIGMKTSTRSSRTHPHRNRGISYADMLVPSVASANNEPLVAYDPFFLDNPRFRQGKHHTVMKLDGLTISVIPFVKPKKLKEQLNEQFHELHPWIHQSLTLSKLRNLKADIFSLLDQLVELDPSTVASAWVYFERLVLQRVVEKSNRKLFCFACVLLAYKFNQAAHTSVLKNLVQALQKLDPKENLHSREMFATEFQVFMLLRFSLQLKLEHVLPHIQQYLESKDLMFEELYGTTEEAFVQWSSGFNSPKDRREHCDDFGIESSFCSDTDSQRLL